MDGSEVFVDTNILLYLFNADGPWYDRARQAVARLRQENRPLCISGQSIREFCAVASRRDWVPGPLDAGTIASYARGLMFEFNMATETASVLEVMLDMIRQYGVQGRQVYDLHLVATMRANRIGTLLTNNPQDFKAYAQHITVLDLAQAG